MVLYVVSAERGEGKTAVSAGLGRYLKNRGQNAGYLRRTAGGDDSESEGRDAAFMRLALGLPETEKMLAADLKEASSRAGRDRDTLIIEDMIARDSHELAVALDARVVIVAAYPPRLPGLVEEGKRFGERLRGVILNKVPSSQVERVRAEASSLLDSAGIKLLGILPEDRLLLSPTVGELAERLGGQILNSPEKADDLVETVMVGAMCVDSGLVYFGRKDNKAAVVRSDRPDMQLAAMETSTRCLVLSGGNQPIYGIMNKAEKKGIPVVLTDSDTSAAIAEIEDALSQVRLAQAKKLPRLVELVKENIDLEALIKH